MKNEGTQEFELRTYGRTELAKMYSPSIKPQSAYVKLMRWIGKSPELSTYLRKSSKRPNNRTFTSDEVKMIIQVLGEP